MSAFYHFGRSKTQGPILNDGTYRSYGAIEAALAGEEVHSIDILANTIGLLLAIPFALICVAIIVAIISGVSGGWLVVGQAIAPSQLPPKPLFPSRRLVDLPGWISGIHGCVSSAWILRFVLSILWVGVDCAAGVPLVGHYYGIETLGLEYAAGSSLFMFDDP
ncbi:hypothetical protein EDD85DRAFT_796128 [Armillaria nabsnona]|nr:hypothetical protein EDD85DRAFT_796128 [Armillaria nabsnona]